MDNKGFEDIEDFYLAYKARFKEYKQIKDLTPTLQILIMHWGGVIIENYVKFLLVRSTGAKKERTKLWYTLGKFNYIIGQGNSLNKGDYPRYKCAENPQHKIEDGITKIEVLNNLLTDDDRIKQAVNTITYPLGIRTKNGFIDLRYVSPNQISDLDELFAKWNESFKRLLKWLIDNTENIEVSLDA